MSDEKQFLTAEEAEAMLPDGEYIHTFSNPDAGIILGADTKREKIIELLRQKSGKIEVAGETAQRMNHGIALIEDGRRLFIATKAVEE